MASVSEEFVQKFAPWQVVCWDATSAPHVGVPADEDEEELLDMAEDSLEEYPGFGSAAELLDFAAAGEHRLPASCVAVGVRAPITRYANAVRRFELRREGASVLDVLRFVQGVYAGDVDDEDKAMILSSEFALKEPLVQKLLVPQGLAAPLRSDVLGGLNVFEGFEINSDAGHDSGSPWTLDLTVILGS